MRVSPRTPSLNTREEYILLMQNYSTDFMNDVWKNRKIRVSCESYENYGADSVTEVLICDTKDRANRDKMLKALRDWGYELYHIDNTPKVYSITFGVPSYVIVARKEIPYVWLEDRYIRKSFIRSGKEPYRLVPKILTNKRSVLLTH